MTKPENLKALRKMNLKVYSEGPSILRYTKRGEDSGVSWGFGVSGLRN